MPTYLDVGTKKYFNFLKNTISSRNSIFYAFKMLKDLRIPTYINPIFWKNRIFAFMN